MFRNLGFVFQDSCAVLGALIRKYVELWLLVSVLIVWYGQALHGGIFSDAAIFARSSAAMLDGYLYGNPTHAHAPVARYAMAASQAIFGMTTFAVKLPSVIFAIGTVVLTYRIGRFVFTRNVGFVAALLLAGNAMFTRWTATGYLDITLVFVVTGLTYAILRWNATAIENRRLRWLLGALLVVVCATMLQGAIFAFAGAIAILYSSVRRSTDKERIRQIAKDLVLGMIGALVIVYAPFLFSPHPEYYGGHQLPKVARLIFAVPFLSNIIYAFGESAIQNFGHISAGHSIEVAGRSYQHPPFWSFAYWMVTGSGLVAAFGFIGIGGMGATRNFNSQTVIATISTVIPFILVSSVSVKNPNYVLPIFPVLLVWAVGPLEKLLKIGVARIQGKDARQVLSGVLAVSIVISVAVVAPTTVGPVQSDSGIEGASKAVADYSTNRTEPVRVAAATPLPVRWYFGDKRTGSYSFEAESIRYFDLDDDGDTDVILSGGYQNETIQQRLLSDLRNGSLCLAIEIPGQTSSPLSGQLKNATIIAEFPRTTKGDRVVVYQFPSNCPPPEK